MPGPKPQSAAVREAKGNPGKRRRSKTKGSKKAPATDAKGPPAADTKSDLAPPPKVPGGMPRELTKGGKTVWNIIAPMLVRSNFYHPTYRLSLTRYCDTVAEYWKVTRLLRKKSYTYEAKKVGGGTMLRFNPLFMVQDRLARRLDTLEHNFGLNPRARGEIMNRLAEQAPQLPLGDGADAPGPAPDPHHESAVNFLTRSPTDGPSRIH